MLIVVTSEFGSMRGHHNKGCHEDSATADNGEKHKEIEPSV